MLIQICTLNDTLIDTITNTITDTLTDPLKSMMKAQYLEFRSQGQVKSKSLLITERLLRPLRQACSGGIIEKPSAVAVAVKSGRQGESGVRSHRIPRAPLDRNARGN